MTTGTVQRRRLLTLAMVVVVIDQVSKQLVANLLSDGRTIRLIPGVLDLRLVHNTGAAFSLFRGSVAWLGLLSLVVSIGLGVWLIRRRSIPLWQGLAVAALLGGTIGNGIDRWLLGYVIDFLALVPIDFPIFNLADVAINLAVACFAVDVWVSGRSNQTGS